MRLHSIKNPYKNLFQTCKKCLTTAQECEKYSYSVRCVVQDTARHNSKDFTWRLQQCLVFPVVIF